MDPPATEPEAEPAEDADDSACAWGIPDTVVATGVGLLTCLSLGLLAGLATIGPTGSWPRPRRFATRGLEQQTARADVQALQDAVTIFVMRNHRLPTLDELVTADERGETYLRNMTEAPRDPWGTAYAIRQGDRLSQFEIVSYGPDRQEGTKDDISSRAERAFHRDMDRILAAAWLFAQQHQRVPALAELLTADHLPGQSELPRDPWGTPYEIRAKAPYTDLEVRSHGPDRLPDTPDDVRCKGWTPR